MSHSLAGDDASRCPPGCSTSARLALLPAGSIPGATTPVLGNGGWVYATANDGTLVAGVHATYPVGYALAAMSVVSRLGQHLPTSGLDAETALAATTAEVLIRQLATLSAIGEFVPDDPTSRPALP